MGSSQRWRRLARKARVLQCRCIERSINLCVQPRNDLRPRTGRCIHAEYRVRIEALEVEFIEGRNARNLRCALQAADGKDARFARFHMFESEAGVEQEIKLT